MKLKLTFVVTALLTALSVPAARADSVSFTLVNNNAGINVSGGSYTFDATVSAAAGNSGPIYLNGDSFNVTAPVTLNDGDFFSNFPLSLAPGASYTGDLFVVSVSPNSPFGTYLGTFTLLGGSDGNAMNSLGTVNFALATTPEPSSLALLFTGAAVFACFGFERSRRVALR